MQLKSDFSMQGLLPLLVALILSTIFNATLTWNDLHILRSLRKAKGAFTPQARRLNSFFIATSTESQNLHGDNEAPIRLAQVLQVVEANGHYGMSADSEWETLLPSNHATGIHPSPSHERQEYVAVYHQISCLNSLRKLYMNPGWADDAQKQDTAHHCLNVLRQAVLCNGDTTLEPSHPELHSNGKEVAAASGMDVAHVCRNWEELRTMSEVDSFAVNAIHHSVTSSAKRGDEMEPLE
ncbi:hypothetical protein NP233_g2026 [Leucocoprinus birnbaumii]|uniref:Uncharacterized protein n=1 Tax=Leucocoprinus birnbaumii TaxID=56174 RepID=A0AAD5VZ32_9AGAR|nr:hypothetical protein NP233_g2026 [Leucocoprinus birnbaumii]